MLNEHNKKQFIQKHKTSKGWWLVLIIFLGGSLRLIAAWVTNSFWFDEVVSASLARLPLADTWSYLRFENSPPLHFWLLNIWGHIFGFSDLTLKLSSVALGTLNIYLIYLLGQRLFRRQAGLWAAVIVAFSSFQIFYSQEARMYQLVLTLSLISLYFFWQWLKRGASWVRLLLSGLFTLLAIYTHLTALVLPIIQFTLLLWTRKSLSKNTLDRWLIVQTGVVGAFLPWLWTFWQAKQKTFNPGAWYFFTERFNFFLLEVPKQFVLFAGDSHFLELLFVVVFGSLFIFSIFQIKLSEPSSWRNFNKDTTMKEKPNDDLSPILSIKSIIDQSTKFALIILFTPLIIGFWLNVNVVKYYIIASVGLYLLLGQGLQLALVHLKQNKHLANFAWVLPTLALLIMLPATLIVMMRVSPGWDKVVSYIEQREQTGDKILAATFAYALPVQYYYQGQLPIEGFYPLEDKGNDLLLRVLQRNWYSIITQENITKLNNYTKDARRIFLVSSAKVFVTENDLVKSWFFKNGWRLIDDKTFYGLADPNVLILERIDTNNTN